MLDLDTCATMRAQLQAMSQTIHQTAADEVTFLLHYADRHRHAQHLLWSCSRADAESLLRWLIIGGGPGLNTAFHERGISFELVACWPGGLATRRDRRRGHNNKRHCPRCCYGRARQPRLF